MNRVSNLTSTSDLMKNSTSNSTNDYLFFVIAGATLACLTLFIAAYFWWKKFRLHREIQRRVKIALDGHIYNGSIYATRDEENPPRYLKKSSQLTLPLTTVTEITEKAWKRSSKNHQVAIEIDDSSRPSTSRNLDNSEVVALPPSYTNSTQRVST
ncbi:hypothetical protein K7432_010218 [Basidiobolus ranarum]|uniref:Uncharacterized protein n=1 Tax=Basidiobolus ranarum TaxID=34480 RepID=A0ABR2VVT4_9FUNG